MGGAAQRRGAHAVHGASSSTSGPLWAAKALAARRYRPSTRAPGALTTTVHRARSTTSPRRCSAACWRASRANGPTELIAVVDGGDADVAAVAADYCDRVLRDPEGGQARGDRRRAARPATRRPTSSSCSTPTRVWAPGALREMLRPFADPRVGGVTPRQAIFDVGDQPGAPARGLDRGHPLPPDRARAVGVRPGRLPRRAHDRLPARPRSSRRSSALVGQTVLGVPQHVGDDRVLTNELLRDGLADRLPVDRAGRDRRAVGLARRSGASSCAGAARASARRCSACAGCGAGRSRSPCFATDIVTPFALYAVVGARASRTRCAGDGGATGLPLAVELPLGYVGMLREHRRAPDPAPPARSRATCRGCRCSCCSSRS